MFFSRYQKSNIFNNLSFYHCLKNVFYHLVIFVLIFYFLRIKLTQVCKFPWLIELSSKFYVEQQEHYLEPPQIYKTTFHLRNSGVYEIPYSCGLDLQRSDRETGINLLTGTHSHNQEQQSPTSPPRHNTQKTWSHLIRNEDTRVIRVVTRYQKEL